jgi:hypothetical protein
MTKAQQDKTEQIYADLMLQTTNCLLTVTRLMFLRAQIIEKTPDRKDLIQDFDNMIDNLNSVHRAEENKTLKLKVLTRAVYNRNIKIRDLEYDLKKALKMNEHLMDGI